MSLSLAEFFHEFIRERRTTEYASRRELIIFLLKSISSSSILIASGWIILLSSSKDFYPSNSILLACTIHIIVVALVMLTAFSLIIAHTWSKVSFEEIETHSSGLYSAVMIASGESTPTDHSLDSVLASQKKLLEEYPKISKKWDPKIKKANLVAWILGSLAVLLFVLSIGLDVLVGFTII